MALAPAEQEIIELTQWAGLRNNVRPERLAPEDLTVARNVDIDDSKQLKRRRGYTLARAGAIKSVWSDSSIALGVGTDTTLLRILPDYSVTTLRTALTPGQAMSYVGAGGRVYYSNGMDTGCVDNGRNRTWGLAIPTGQPAAAAVGGVLDAGRYQFAVTFLRSDGQESGTLPAAFISVPDNGGISLTLIPVPSDPDVTGKALYFSDADSDTLYRAGVVGPAVTTFTWTNNVLTKEVSLRTQHLRPAPAGQLVGTLFGAWAFVAVGNTLYYSEPWSLELFDLRKNYRFLSPITMVAGLEDGVMIGTETETVWLSGTDPMKFENVPKLPYGVIRSAYGMCGKNDIDGGTGDALVFATTQGLCVADGSGAVTNFTRDRFAYPIQQQGALAVRQHRGMIQTVCTLQGTERAGNVA